ncbi:hypothetical protein ALO83_104077 [Pseudomonas cannabina pv. alisalensis]|uniref:Uncharacterized protein n=1 Tax=Pseudomonas cannabina TaxID=86840 RepID=A0A3M3QJR2_PSECA|nr:hypothetical protein ALO83_104077 [Pseudomonas cannabina pv. alisalensis]RMN84424.1 hypothetical protein ALQ53_103807 [Pseudomonas cannabina]RMN86181.1 hypothetical protein ALQ52_104815 [Pseudomonas cannabina pv. alisalensis]RMN91122.1 hypothetical protein ALQ51_102385 [Pseudomonas cannabina]
MYRRDSQPLKKTFLNVLYQLGTAMISLAAEVAMLAPVANEMTISFVICKAMQPELKFDDNSLIGNVER